MARGIEFLALAALLTGCKPAGAPAGNAAEPPDPLANIAAASVQCPDLNPQLTSQPEADARAAFAGNDTRFRILLVMGVGPETSAPGPDWNRVPAECMRRMPVPIRGGTDTRPCVDFYRIATLYIERFNREMARLCAVAASPTPH